MLPLTGAIFIASALAAPLAAKLSSRLLMTLGLALTGGGLLLLRGLSPSSSWTALLAGFLVCGAGVGVFNVVRAETAVSLVPPSRSGEASGIGSTFQEVGVALGIAVLGALFQHRMRGSGPGLPAAGGSTVLSAPVGRDFVHAMDQVFLVAGVAALAGALIVLLTVRATGWSAPTGEQSEATAPLAATR
jgi:fucose permease